MSDTSATELIEMARKAERENANLIPRSTVNADHDTQRTWSNGELNAWLKQSLAAEREEIRQRTVKGMNASFEKNNDALIEMIAETNQKNADHMVEEMGKAIAKVTTDMALLADTNAKLQNNNNENFKKRIAELEAEVAALKANQKKKGWFS